MYVKNLLFTISKPTRPDTKSLIDNIFTNDPQVNEKQDRCIKCADLLDYFPIYNLSRNINIADNNEWFAWKRKRTENLFRPLYAFLAVATGLNYSMKQMYQTALDIFDTKPWKYYDNHFPVKNYMKKIHGSVTKVSETPNTAIKHNNILCFQQLPTKRVDDSTITLIELPWINV